MKQKKYILLLIYSFFVSSILFLGISCPIFAQSSIPLIVAPARQQITLDPGEQTTITVKFYNESNSPISGIIRVADFIVEGKDGSPRIIEDAKQSSPKYSATSWITMPYDRMSIPANDKVVVQATLAVPKNARAGGRYVSFYFEPNTNIPQAVSLETAGQGTAPRIASLLYIRVSGPIIENAIISNLFTKSFYEYGPVTVSSEILNRGDYHIRPRGILTLIDPFGSILSQTPLSEENIFPDAARQYTNTMGQKWMIGKYKINLMVSYGEKGQAIERTIAFWVFPWKVALIIFLTIVIIVIIIRNIYKKIVTKESALEAEIAREKEEIEKMKEELKKRHE